MHTQNATESGLPNFRLIRLVCVTMLASRVIVRTRRTISTKRMAVLFGLLFIITLYLFSLETSKTLVAACTALASIPTFVALAIVMWVDRHEPEPPRWLFFAFGWGATVATLVSYFANSMIGLALFGSYDHPGTAVVVAPFVEETMKVAGLLIILLFIRSEFDGLVDACVYTAFVGLGFAFTENISYLARGFSLGTGEDSLFQVLWIRGVLTPFVHPLMTLATGIAIGLWAIHGRKRLWLIPVGFILSVASHAGWNLSATTGAFNVMYLFIAIPMFLMICAIVVVARNREKRTIMENLQLYVQAGWLSAHHADILMDPKKRARVVARSAHRDLYRGAVRRGAHRAADLAILRHRMNKHCAPANAVQIEHSLLIHVRHATKCLDALENTEELTSAF